MSREAAGRHAIIEPLNAGQSTFLAVRPILTESDMPLLPVFQVRLRRLLVPFLFGLVAVVYPDVTGAQTAENVVVIVNDNSPLSRQVADYYIAKRAIPASNVVHLRTSTDESIERSAYVATIEQPIGAALGREGLQDRALYLVLTKGIPLRINGSSGPTGTVASVDSELTLLYRRMLGLSPPTAGRVDNPYFLGERDLAQAGAFSHRNVDIFLVSRLDGFTLDDIRALIDKGSSPTRDGRIVLDQQDKLVDRAGESWLDLAATRLAAAGFGDRVLLDTTVQGVRDVSPVLGYYSWGSNDPRNRVRAYGMGFVPGALAATFVSTDARTFTEPPATWVPGGDWSDRRGFFAGSPQTLTGDLIREGATGVAGHVAEPYLQSTIRPQVLFPAYLGGFNLVEAFYLAMPHLSWQTIVVGDPLTRPFARMPLSRAEIEATPDPETGLPGYFSRRLLSTLAAQIPGVPTPALALGVRGEAALSRSDLAGAVSAFEEATRLAPAFAGAHFQLAALLERQGNREGAAERYRRVIELQPRNVLALNNLAYLTATHLKRPADALPLAQRALGLAPQNPVILDTLGWVQYLLGDTVTAARMLGAAAKGAPNNAEVRLHAAIVSAASGARAAAEFELAEALRLDPSLEKSPDVTTLRQQLEKLGSSR